MTSLSILTKNNHFLLRAACTGAFLLFLAVKVQAKNNGYGGDNSGLRTTPELDLL